MPCHCRTPFYLEKVETDAHYSLAGLRIGLDGFNKDLTRKALGNEIPEEGKKYEAIVCLDENGQKCLLVKKT
ncbi:MAG: hypothetical protein PHG24_02775 [Candidatus Pacebacteria bacterium]|nr:hypothetical protein [Candidatus Paceibacterota bacterium]